MNDRYYSDPFSLDQRLGMSLKQSAANKDDSAAQIAGMVSITINCFACFVQRSSWPQDGVASLVSGLVWLEPECLTEWVIWNISNDPRFQNNNNFLRKLQAGPSIFLKKMLSSA